MIVFTDHLSEWIVLRKEGRGKQRGVYLSHDIRRGKGASSSLADSRPLSHQGAGQIEEVALRESDLLIESERPAFNVELPRKMPV